MCIKIKKTKKNSVLTKLFNSRQCIVSTIFAFAIRHICFKRSLAQVITLVAE